MHQLDKLYEGVTSGDHSGVDYPVLSIPVWIEGNCFRQGAVAMFAKAGCYAARTIEEAELVCFLGGEDVDPELYGEKPLPQTYYNRSRDDREKIVYDRAVELNIPMFGICRGMQFIHVMAGGKLYQDVRNHTSPHTITDVETGEQLYASSMHHQMCIANDELIPVAISPGHAGQYLSKSGGTTSCLQSNRVDDLEAAYYPKIGAFCVQGHPEVSGYESYTKWCLNKLADLIAETEQQIEYVLAKQLQGE